MHVSSITFNAGIQLATASVLLAPALTAAKLHESIRGSQRRPTVRRHTQGPLPACRPPFRSLSTCVSRCEARAL
ncbi:hypothetical protein PF002_g32448 [Phytophthora fragariae]|uniref:RxLR effector protein n=1 Tax=Phytophthora fragariae TaxID=53985 RepID=A0A6A3V994_9STRA|nr:hypothetical protein PF002_g32448 [Phytophthora fragariae]